MAFFWGVTNPARCLLQPCFCCTLMQLGIVIRSLSSGHFPPYNFILVTMGSTAVLLVGWRTILYNILPNDKSNKSDVYRRGSPFELFEVWNSVCLPY